MRAFSFHALVLGGIFLGACSTLDLPILQSGGPSEKQSPTKAQQTAPIPYFAGEEGLTVYSEPRESSTPLARLSLHQKVYRDSIEKGYAHVRVEGTNLVGWVDNARLIWRLPPESPGATPQAKKEAGETSPEAQPTPSVPQAESPAPQVQSPADPADKPISPSIFNPF